jgi:ATP-dependent exoDNAse (exonuclease V) alpha subunit
MKSETKSDGIVSVHSLKSGKRSAVHDITHVTYEECQKLIAECSVLISKYHLNLMDFGSYSQDTLQFRNDIKTIRLQIFTKIKQALDKIAPYLDQ